MSGGTSYINSNVSLISKASIRYEGTLYSIDPHEATITLSNVRSYGTEDRKVDKFLGAKETLFEYIIFKANDIKELIVDEPLNDPAIVTATTSTSTENAYSGFSDENQSNLQANGLFDTQSKVNGNINQTIGTRVSSPSQTGDRFKSRGPTPSSPKAPSPISELNASNKQKSDSNKMSRGANDNNSHSSNVRNQKNQRRRWDNNRMNYNTNNLRNLNNQMNRKANYHQNYRGSHNRGFCPRNDLSNHMNNNRNVSRNNYNSINNNRNVKRNGYYKVIPESNKKFVKEFDFEKSNKAFQQMVDKLEDLNIVANGEKSSDKSGPEDKEEATRTEVEKSDKEGDGNFYDKTKSFFDNISCEAIERTKGSQKRFDWKQERKLNAETFGLKIIYRRRSGGYNNNFNNSGYNRNNLNQNPRYNNSPSQQARAAQKTDSSA